MELLNLNETASFLHVTRQTVQRWARLGIIPAIKMNARKYLFDRKELEKVLKLHATKTK